MNDEKLSGGTEYHTGTTKPADLDQDQESSPLTGARKAATPRPPPRARQAGRRDTARLP